MFGVNPVIELVNEPVPDPSIVLLLLVVGLEVVVLQQTPRTVTEPPPSFVIFPPDSALDIVIEDAELVLIVGNIMVEVLKLTCGP